MSTITFRGRWAARLKPDNSLAGWVRGHYGLTGCTDTLTLVDIITIIVIVVISVAQYLINDSIRMSTVSCARSTERIQFSKIICEHDIVLAYISLV